MEFIDEDFIVNEVKQLHARVGVVWGEKKKYMESMRRSEEHIREVSKKEMNEERVKLIGKLESHISKVMG
jgi:predicted nuclease with TOPRIM domain